KHLECNLKNLIHRQSFGLAKELATAGASTTDIRWLRCAAQVNGGRTHRRNDHEGLVTDDWVVAFDPTLIVWVVPAAFLERNVAAARDFVTVAIVFGKANAPTIAQRGPVRLCLGFGRGTILCGSAQWLAVWSADQA